jgi:hypothetical protein
MIRDTSRINPQLTTSEKEISLLVRNFNQPFLGLALIDQI